MADIMRGEETEAFGILSALTGEGPAVIVLPGTHNKILRINEKGEIVDFQTTLSGELLDMVITDSILSGSVSHEFSVSEVDVLRGASYAQRHGLNAALFHLRVMEKNGVAEDQRSSFLYGAVLREDVAAVSAYADGGPVYIGGNSVLQSVYFILLKDLFPICLDRAIADRAVLAGLQNLHAVHNAYGRREGILKAIAREKLIAILRAPARDTLIPAVQALYAGGVRLLEITFDRSGTLSREEVCSMLREISAEFGERMLIGAGKP